MEPDAKQFVPSAREDSISVNIINLPSVSTQCFQQLKVSREEDEDKYNQGFPAAQYEQKYVSTGQSGDKDTLNKDVSVHAGSEDTRGGEDAPRERVLTMVTSPTVYQSTPMSHPQLSGEQTQNQTLHLAEHGATVLGTSGRPKSHEPSSENKVLGLICAEEPQAELIVPASLSPPLHMTPDPSQACCRTETPQDLRARDEAAANPWSSAQSSEPTQPRPPSAQFIDCLPTFTSQRPTDLPTALSKRASSDSWSVHSPAGRDHRYVQIGRSERMLAACYTRRILL